MKKSKKGQGIGRGGVIISFILVLIVVGTVLYFISSEDKGNPYDDVDRIFPDYGGVLDEEEADGNYNEDYYSCDKELGEIKNGEEIYIMLPDGKSLTETALYIDGSDIKVDVSTVGTLSWKVWNIEIRDKTIGGISDRKIFIDEYYLDRDNYKKLTSSAAESVPIRDLLKQLDGAYILQGNIICADEEETDTESKKEQKDTDLVNDGVFYVMDNQMYYHYNDKRSNERTSLVVTPRKEYSIDGFFDIFNPSKWASFGSKLNSVGYDGDEEDVSYLISSSSKSGNVIGIIEDSGRVVSLEDDMVDDNKYGKAFVKKGKKEYLVYKDDLEERNIDGLFYIDNPFSDANDGDEKTKSFQVNGNELDELKKDDIDEEIKIQKEIRKGEEGTSLKHLIKIISESNSDQIGGIMLDEKVNDMDLYINLLRGETLEEGLKKIVQRINLKKGSEDERDVKLFFTSKEGRRIYFIGEEKESFTMYRMN